MSNLLRAMLHSVRDEASDSDALGAGGGGGGKADTSTSTTSSTTDSAQQSGAQSEQSGQNTTAADGETGGEKTADQAAPKSALEAVRRVMGDERQAAETAAAASKDTKTGADAGTTTAATDAGGNDKDPDRLTEAEWKGLSPRVQKRMGTLTRQRRDADTALTTMRAQFEPTVSAYNGLMGWVNNAGLDANEFSTGLEIMRLRKADPAKAYAMLQPLMRELQEHVGEILPDDLAKAVEDGRVAEDVAKELAAKRKETIRLSRTTEATTAAHAEAESRRTAADAQQRVVSAISGWEATFKQTDPDYPKIAAEVWERMVFLMQGKKNLDDAAIVKIADQARTDVKKRISDRFPVKGAKQPILNGNAVQTQKAPGSALEAARMAVAATAG